MSDFRESYNNAWLAGSRSIILSHHPLHRFPLSTEHLLGEMEQVHYKRRHWEVAYQWLEVGMETLDGVTQELARKSLVRLDEIPWDEAVPGQFDHSILRSCDLAQLLSTEWLDDEVVNSASTWVQRHAAVGEQSNGVHAAFLSPLFYDHLSNRLNDTDKPF